MLRMLRYFRETESLCGVKMLKLASWVGLFPRNSTFFTIQLALSAPYSVDCPAKDPSPQVWICDPLRPNEWLPLLSTCRRRGTQWSHAVHPGTSLRKPIKQPSEWSQMEDYETFKYEPWFLLDLSGSCRHWSCFSPNGHGCHGRIMVPPIELGRQESKVKLPPELLCPSSNVNVGLIDFSDVVLRLHKLRQMASHNLLWFPPSLKVHHLQLQIPWASNITCEYHLVPTTVYLYNVSEYPREAMGSGHWEDWRTRRVQADSRWGLMLH